MKNQKIKNGLMVHAKGAGSMGGAAGAHVGTVDHLDGEKFIKLTKNDSKDGKHHWIPVDWVSKTDEKAVYLSKTKDEFYKGMLDNLPSNAQKTSSSTSSNASRTSSTSQSSSSSSSNRSSNSNPSLNRSSSTNSSASSNRSKSSMGTDAGGEGGTAGNWGGGATTGTAHKGGDLKKTRKAS